MKTNRRHLAVHSLRVLSVCAVLCACLGAQRTWIVDWSMRAGSDFNAVQPAVDAAASGDTISIRGAGVGLFNPLDHGYPAPVIDGKGLAIIGEGSATTWISGIMRIRNVPVGHCVTVARLRIGTEFEGTFQANATVISSQCRGPVLFRDVDMSGWGLREVSDCDLCILSGCAIRPACTIQPIRSNLMVDGCTMYTVFPYDYFPLGPWGAAIDIVQSRVWITNSYLFGSDDQPGSVTSYYRPALYTKDSDVWIGPGTTLRGGVANWGDQPAIYDHNQLRGDGTYSIPRSRLMRDPGAVIIGGIGPGMGLNPTINGPVTAMWAMRNGDTLTVEQRCTPSSMTVLALGPFQLQPVPNLLTPLAIDLTQSWLCMVAAPTTGAFQSSFAIPPNLPLGFQIGLQMGAMAPTGEISLSNATMFGIF